MSGIGLPLQGTTVVALEQAVAGPIATRHLADLGARVIKLERPGEGDFARHYDSAVNGLVSHFVWLNRSKESFAVDLKSDRGREIATTLIARADVFLHNTAPGVVERLGLDADTLRGRDPRLVVVNISGYGTSGPRRDRKAYDMLVQAESRDGLGHRNVGHTDQDRSAERRHRCRPLLSAVRRERTATAGTDG